MISPPQNFGIGYHQVEIFGFEECCDGTVQLEVHLPCDEPDVWRIVRSGPTECMLCGQVDAEVGCFATDSQIPTTRLADDEWDDCDLQHNLCTVDRENLPEWRGSQPQCLECTSAEIEQGECGATCVLSVDGRPSAVANAIWGVGSSPCTPGMVLLPGERCDFACPEGYVSYSGDGGGGGGYEERPYAACNVTDSGYGLLHHSGQCVPTECIDQPAWAVDFKSSSVSVDKVLLAEQYGGGCDLGAQDCFDTVKRAFVAANKMSDQHIMSYPVLKVEQDEEDPSSAMPQDLNGDGIVGVDDLLSVMAAFGDYSPWYEQQGTGAGRRLQRTGSGTLAVQIVTHAPTDAQAAAALEEVSAGMTMTVPGRGR